MNPLSRILTGAGAAALLIAGTALAAPKARHLSSGQAARTVRSGWVNTIVATPEGGVRMGNPAAPVKLVEYASYSCPHCAHFQAEGVPEIEKGDIASGRVSLEVRSVIRNPVDLAAHQLARCGAASRFFGNHKLIFAQQSAWFDRAMKLGPDRQKSWGTGPAETRMVRIAADTGLDRLLLTRGYTPAQIRQCLANVPAQQRAVAVSNAAFETYNIEGTPSFLLNGQLVPDTFSWATLAPILAAAR